MRLRKDGALTLLPAPEFSGDAERAVEEADDVLPDEVVDGDAAAEPNRDDGVGHINGLEPDDAGGAELENAVAVGEGGSNGQQKEGQRSAVDADGEMRALMGSEPEHVPEAPARGDERHGKDETALNGDGHLKDEANDDERREHQRQDERSDKDSGEVSAKVRVRGHKAPFESSY